MAVLDMAKKQRVIKIRKREIELERKMGPLGDFLIEFIEIVSAILIGSYVVALESSSMKTMLLIIGMFLLIVAVVFRLFKKRRKK